MHTDKLVVQSRSPISEHHRSPAGSPPTTPERLSASGSPRRTLPPTPPLPGTSSFDFMPRSGSHSPNVSGQPPMSTLATHSGTYATQKSSYPPVPEPSQWRGSTSPISSRRLSDESASSVAAKSQSTYPDPSESMPRLGLLQQKPLPTDFPPPIPSPTQLPHIGPQMVPTQYHHHYPTNSSLYPPSTDRYQCLTCQKAFSRPSSLKIHTYSHTGEKPFKCKYDGCGKFFSVRSNMKRHEKGCHGIETSSTDGLSPSAS